MTALQAWRERMGWTQRRAAEALGLSLKSYQQQERERSWNTGAPVAPPRTTLLAAAALENRIEPVSPENPTHPS